MVDNNGRTAKAGSTPIRSVGRHTITAVQLSGSGEEWIITVEGEPWTAIDTTYAWGIDGIEVDLDAIEDDSALYRIVRNTESTITLKTDDDLSGIVGQALVGVHQLDQITVIGGAAVDFGEDKILISDLSQSFFDTTTVINAGKMIIAQSLTLDNQQWALSSLGETVEIEGDLTLSNGSLLQVPTYRSSDNGLRATRLQVSGTITVDETSSINANGSGYPSDDWSGPDFAGTTRGGCHGGIRNNTTEDCTYGRYEQAQFAGSGGRNYYGSYTGTGGGVIELIANELILEGKIQANGMDGGRPQGSQSAGAGGGIHIEVGSFSGSGQIEASGGSNRDHPSYPAGAGGRISVYVTEDTFTGDYRASSGSIGAVSGAGTIYIKNSADDYGHLMADNNGREAKVGSTPIRSVGRHRITGVELSSSGEEWLITVEGEPWTATDTTYAWGIDGIEVDLDAIEDDSALYRIVRNTESTITLKTDDDLSGIVGQSLVGVHQLDQITVIGGAAVDFGEDKVLINPFGSYLIDTGGSIDTGVGSDL